MASAKIVHQLTLPAGADPEAFETFMRERYFPAVHRGPTRVGLIEDLALWRDSRTDPERTTFLLVCDFDGAAGDRMPRLDDDAVAEAFDAFRPTVTFLGTYHEVVTLAGAAAGRSGR